jgi:hypothetical protein
MDIAAMAAQAPTANPGEPSTEGSKRPQLITSVETDPGILLDPRRTTILREE